MDSAELLRELERLAEEVRAHRTRLAELGTKISTACELVATIRSSLRGDERTPPSQVAQGAGPAASEDRGEARAG